MKKIVLGILLLTTFATADMTLAELVSVYSNVSGNNMSRCGAYTTLSKLPLSFENDTSRRVRSEIREMAYAYCGKKVDTKVGHLSASDHTILMLSFIGLDDEEHCKVSIALTHITASKDTAAMYLKSADQNCQIAQLKQDIRDRDAR